MMISCQLLPFLALTVLDAMGNDGGECFRHGDEAGSSSEDECSGDSVQQGTPARLPTKKAKVCRGGKYLHAIESAPVPYTSERAAGLSTVDDLIMKASNLMNEMSPNPTATPAGALVFTFSQEMKLQKEENRQLELEIELERARQRQ